ncbi:5-oxoprolinase subunit PxpA [Maribacter sp. 1_2014MBL_MicDiv]|uniref:5-oxoprolinase subunit PxpA n=1 Tax=Maribacter sp. 1_2014MBL_MicDiv TaxID=1644130 RepID=UPI0008F4C5C4|nr:5-oxoprolinase subunit PxpA [Maribacter sp. 1_2014MBL_MicDiv]APA65660.1 LamB/YcsF family protein [Maribacter sp. 1_2014MBL_MicDiv]
MNNTIDINCDVGEGVGNESELFPLISSCNISCGAHAGSIDTIKKCLDLSKSYNVKVGAHPSYPDRKNFGRVSLQISKEDLIASIRSQMEVFNNAREQAGVDLHHIKPHGALYNDIAKNETLAEIFLESIAGFRNSTFLYVPYYSVIQRLAEKNGFRILVEAFADRNYNDDLSLVTRKEKNALLNNGEEVLAHILYMHKNKKVKTVSGKSLPMYADTFCIHGDTPSALQILTYITEYLSEHNL